MKTDPNKGCKNQTEKLGWAVLHDLVAHPVMALTGYSNISMRFHNYTSHKAWPRTPKPEPVPEAQSKEACNHHAWALSCPENGWQSYCLFCGTTDHKDKQ